MPGSDSERPKLVDLDIPMTPGVRAEMEALGVFAPQEERAEKIEGIDPVDGRPLVSKTAVSAPEALNEAHAYEPRPSYFSRGMRVELPGATMIFLSGTASVDQEGRTVHPGDFHAQCLRTYWNMTRLLASEGASWHDVVRTTCYLRDIDRDYDDFNDTRTMFLRAVGTDPIPASTGIQAKLCRSDLLIEMEAIAIIPSDSET
jgi:enamine deaminase RidA (YjgF/YER057c/UK114 family)